MKTKNFLYLVLFFLLIPMQAIAASKGIECVDSTNNQTITESVIVGEIIKCRQWYTDRYGNLKYNTPSQFLYQKKGENRWYWSPYAQDGWISLSPYQSGIFYIRSLSASLYKEIPVVDNTPDRIEIDGIPDKIDIRVSEIEFKAFSIIGSKRFDITDKMNVSISADGLDSLLSYSRYVKNKITVNRLYNKNYSAEITVSFKGKSEKRDMLVLGSSDLSSAIPVIKAGEILEGEKAPKMGRIFLEMPHSGDDSLIFLAYYKNQSSPLFKYYDMSVNVNGTWNPFVYKNNNWSGGYKELYINARHSFPYEMMLARIPKDQPDTIHPTLGVFVEKGNSARVKQIVKSSNLSNFPNTKPFNSDFGYACPTSNNDEYPAGYFCAKSIDLTGNKVSATIKDRVGMMNAYDEDHVTFTLTEKSDIRLLLEGGRAYCTIYDTETMEQVQGFDIRHAQGNECDALYKLEAGKYILVISPYNTDRNYYDSDYKVEISRSTNEYDSELWQTYITSKIHSRYNVGEYKDEVAVQPTEEEIAVENGNGSIIVADNNDTPLDSSCYLARSSNKRYARGSSCTQQPVLEYCKGIDCSKKYPQNTTCISDAKSIGKRSNDYVTVEIMESKACETKWTKTTPNPEKHVDSKKYASIMKLWSNFHDEFYYSGKDDNGDELLKVNHKGSLHSTMLYADEHSRCKTKAYGYDPTSTVLLYGLTVYEDGCINVHITGDKPVSIRYGNYLDKLCVHGGGEKDSYTKCQSYEFDEDKFKITDITNSDRGYVFWDLRACYDEFASSHCSPFDLEEIDNFHVYSHYPYGHDYERYKNMEVFKGEIEEDYYNIVEAFRASSCNARGISRGLISDDDDTTLYNSGEYDPDPRESYFGHCDLDDGMTLTVNEIDYALIELFPANRIAKYILSLRKARRSTHLNKSEKLKKLKSDTKGKSKKLNKEKRKGDCGEEIVNIEFESEGYEIIDTSLLTNKNGHGIDNIAIKDGEIIFIETKTDKGKLSTKQRKGGKDYVNNQLEEMRKGLTPPFKGRFKSLANKPGAKETFDNINKLLNTHRASYQHIHLFLDDIDDGCSPKGGADNLLNSMTMKSW